MSRMKQRWLRFTLREFLALTIAIAVGLGINRVGGVIRQPARPVAQATIDSMRALGERVAAGEHGAWEELEQVGIDLYRDVHFVRDQERVLQNYLLIEAALEPVWEEYNTADAPRCAAAGRRLLGRL